MAFKWFLAVGLSLILTVGSAHLELRHLQKEYPQPTNWWRHEVFYQIYTRSFKDSNGDGIGDLQGITSKMSYLAETGITAICLSPIFQTAVSTLGYGITDFKTIDVEFGTMEHFDELLAKAQESGIKVILDFVPNHSSDQHDWFKRSAAREEGYEDFYIWQDGTLDNETRVPPNNWVSVYSGSAWEWHEERQQFYLHQFDTQQPDLNYRTPAVLKAVDDILVYWLNRGVAGFRMSDVNFIYEDVELRNEPLSGVTTDPNSADYLQHIYTRNQLEDYTLVQHWRQLLDHYSDNNSGPQRIIMVEAATDLKSLMNYYENEQGVRGAEFPINLDLIEGLNGNSLAQDYVYYIDKWLIYMPAGYAPNWQMGYEDTPRMATRFGVQSVDALNMLMMTLPGITVSYYGDELGMQDNRDISYEDTKDALACAAGEANYKWISRDPERTPMQWSDERNAGFSSGNFSWLPVHPNYLVLNLRAQQQATRSHYKIYQSLLKLRKLRVLQEGSLTARALNRRVLALKRELKGHATMLTIINVSNRTEEVDVGDFIHLPNRLTLLVVGVNSAHRVGERVKPAEINLAPYEGLVIMLKAHK